LKQNSLSLKERIKSKKVLNKIYSTGKILISEDQRIKAIFLVGKEAEESGVKIAVVVSKKQGKAVWRNRVKRLIRESYRLNKQRLVDFCEETNILLMIVFIAFSVTERTNRKVTLKDFMPGVVEIMKRLERKI
jgi:ribonuclease P protein component